MRKCQRPGSPPPRKELRENPVKLCHEISRLARAHVRREADVEGVLSQPGARLILSHLAVQDGQSQLDLVRATHLRPPTVSVILRKMEEEGIVRRQSDQKDQRVLRVYLTEFGRETDERTIARIQTTEAEALRGLSEEEMVTLMSLLGRIRESLIEQERKADKKGEESL